MRSRSGEQQRYKVGVSRRTARALRSAQNISTKVTELNSCAYRARAQHALLCRPSSGLMGGPNDRGLAVARKAGAAVRESRFLRGLCTGATWAFKQAVLEGLLLSKSTIIPTSACPLARNTLATLSAYINTRTKKLCRGCTRPRSTGVSGHARARSTAKLSPSVSRLSRTRVGKVPITEFSLATVHAGISRDPHSLHARARARQRTHKSSQTAPHDGPHILGSSAARFFL